MTVNALFLTEIPISEYSALVSRTMQHFIISGPHVLIFSGIRDGFVRRRLYMDFTGEFMYGMVECGESTMRERTPD